MLVLGHTYILFIALCVLLFSTLWMVIMLFGLCICFGLYGFVMKLDLFAKFHNVLGHTTVFIKFWGQTENMGKFSL